MAKWSNGKKVKFKPLIETAKTLDDPIRKGIDHVFENELFTPPPPPPKYIINDTKMNTKDTIKTPNRWKAMLSKTKIGLQMGDEWIRFNVFETFDRSKAIDIWFNHQRFLTGVAQEGKSLEYLELLDNASKIKKANL